MSKWYGSRPGIRVGCPRQPGFSSAGCERSVRFGWMRSEGAAFSSAGRDRTTGRRLVVVFVAKMGDRLFAHHPAQGVLQLHQLDEEIVLRVEAFRGHRALEVEAEPLLDSLEARALRQVHEQSQVEHHRRCKDRVA